ncbi:MAG: flippase-like domain-containing protein [Chloroflexi bacterium]|nr:flippase-like domain-containing protein [Chloroflexota bacterium]
MTELPKIETESATAPSARRPYLRWAGTLLALGLLVYLLIEQGWAEFFAALQRIPPIYFLAAVGTIFLSRLAVCGRWYALLRSGGARVTPLQASRLVFAGLFASNFLPTTIGGDVVRLAGAIQMGLDAAVSAASLVADRIIGMVGMACMLPFGLPRLFTLATSEMAPLVASTLPLSARFKPALDKLQRLVQTLLQTFTLWIRQPWALAQALLWSFGHMACLFATNWLLLKGMGEPAPFLVIGGLWSLSYFVTLLPISVNGLGVQEVSITYLFSHFGGVSVPAALALAVLIRMLYLLASLPGAAFLPGFIGPRKKSA